ncbi:hypothetical protein SAMN04487897_102423 [Paenibacillus sp. yr247]|uniref:hypothetical protein n=1 Tax=Paenibacillus sp. yr247 TaxID=1761880 RepID=UPI000884C68A|nr:hypothetical protein [Paenibacillus sp. yr247]SDN29631.1 hypothetical protein SAMN04487897_102423 [Paenibacillus sp. yr247]
MKPNHFGLITSSLLFLTFIVLSLVFQSTTYLYIASVCPLLIVPFLPDIRSNQFIKPNQSKGAVRLITMENKEKADSDFLVILFEPGYIKWKRGNLFFNLDDIMKDVYIKPDPFAATMTVLKYDLFPHRSKKNWVGISLAQLEQRTEQLSYTTNEINRLVIQMSDVKELLQRPIAQPSSNRQSVGA